jgi:hypothetical protein
MKWLLKIAGPIYLIGALALLVNGAFSRIPEHDALLELSGSETPILIGAGDHQSSYLVIPRVFYRPSVYSVMEVAPSQFEPIETSTGALIYAIVLVVAAWGFWQFWIAPWRRKSRVAPSA